MPELKKDSDSLGASTVTTKASISQERQSQSQPSHFYSDSLSSSQPPPPSIITNAPKNIPIKNILNKAAAAVAAASTPKTSHSAAIPNHTKILSSQVDSAVSNNNINESKVPVPVKDGAAVPNAIPSNSTILNNNIPSLPTQNNGSGASSGNLFVNNSSRPLLVSGTTGGSANNINDLSNPCPTVVNNLVLSPTSVSSNYKKTDSMHAHFDIQDTLAHGTQRSRSTSVNERKPNSSNILSSLPKSTNAATATLNNAAKLGLVSETNTVGNGADNNDNDAANRLSTPSNVPAANNVASNALTSNIPTSAVSATPVSSATAAAVASLSKDDGKFHVLLGCTGSLGTTKIRSLITKIENCYGGRQSFEKKLSIHVILTYTAERIISGQIKQINSSSNASKENKESLIKGIHNFFPPHVHVWTDADEWSIWRTRTDPVLHIELRRWADVLIVAPLTANSLSKIALGLCDNLLTCVIRAWNTQYPIIVAPLMVNYSYSNVITKRHLEFIKNSMPWIEVLKPVEKVFGSYGEIGMGGMSTENEITARLKDIMKQKFGLQEKEEEEEDEEDAEDDGEDDEDDDDDDDDEDDDDEEEEEEENGVEVLGNGKVEAPTEVITKDAKIASPNVNIGNTASENGNQN